MQPLEEERLDFFGPLLGGRFVWGDDDNVVHVPSVELCTKETDTILVKFVEIDVGEVLGTDVAERDAPLTLWARVDDFAEKPIKLKEVRV